MKIAQLLGSFPRLSETFLVNQITGLIDAGHDVHIFGKPVPNDEPVHQTVRDYKLIDQTRYWESAPRGIVTRTRRAAQHYAASDAATRALLRRSVDPRYGRLRGLALEPFFEALPFDGGCRFDIIHAHFGGNGILAHRLRRLGAVTGPLVVSFHGHDATSRQSAKRQRQYRELFQHADLVTANSGFIGSRLQGLGCPPEKIVRVPESLDPDYFPFRARQLESGESVQLLTVARLSEKKGLEYSIQAVAQLVHDHPEVHYHIIGEGDLRPKLEKLIDELSVRAHVTLHGAQPQQEVRRWYDRAHLFVLASVTASNGDCEGQGLVLQEAQAAGLPVVATQHNGFPDSVAEGESALLVPERDVEALADAINTLIRQPERWPTMGRAGRALVEQKFSIRRTTETLLAAYSRIT